MAVPAVVCGCQAVRQCAAVCGSVCVAVRQCGRVVCGSVWQCARQCGAVCAAVCDSSAHGSVWQRALNIYTQSRSPHILVCLYRGSGNEPHIPRVNGLPQINTSY
jgi:hypothetical protein